MQGGSDTEFEIRHEQRVRTHLVVAVMVAVGAIGAADTVAGQPRAGGEVEHLGPHAADDGGVAGAHDGGAVGVREGGGVQARRAERIGAAGRRARGRGLLLQVAAQERLWRQPLKGVCREAQPADWLVQGHCAGRGGGRRVNGRGREGEGVRA